MAATPAKKAKTTASKCVSKAAPPAGAAPKRPVESVASPAVGAEVNSSRDAFQLQDFAAMDKAMVIAPSFEMSTPAEEVPQTKNATSTAGGDAGGDGAWFDDDGGFRAPRLSKFTQKKKGRGQRERPAREAEKAAGFGKTQKPSATEQGGADANPAIEFDSLNDPAWDSLAPKDKIKKQEAKTRIEREKRHAQVKAEELVNQSTNTRRQPSSKAAQPRNTPNRPASEARRAPRPTIQELATKKEEKVDEDAETMTSEAGRSHELYTRGWKHHRTLSSAVGYRCYSSRQNLGGVHPAKASGADSIVMSWGPIDSKAKADRESPSPPMGLGGLAKFLIESCTSNGGVPWNSINPPWADAFRGANTSIKQWDGWLFQNIRAAILIIFGDDKDLEWYTTCVPLSDSAPTYQIKIDVILNSQGSGSKDMRPVVRRICPCDFGGEDGGRSWCLINLYAQHSPLRLRANRLPNEEDSDTGMREDDALNIGT
ncbi:hypothetical protein FIBSPDRAFT_888295 [Athelia psychrophila]|uniref:Uncharacterized protein n=1 Tax=Athelia psychrophila TaxID=1759441 RepID=A0A166NLQ9_9AGAM|nr:hypothetical protein FIBSPDRAFT_888295 [Fibularhizoctonia sp. CBS 109695]